MSMRRVAVVLLGVLAAIRFPSADEPSHPAQLSEFFKVDSTAIVVDVVVRDRRGRPILDLQKEDFELREDCVPQVIGDVTLVSPGAIEERRSARSPAFTSGEQGPAHPARSAPSFLAVVFDSLTPDARAYAYKGALGYLDAPGGPDDFAGVFLIGPPLYTIEPFTSDPERMRAALHRVSSRATSGDFTIQSDGHSDPSASSAESESRDPGTTAGGGRSGAIARDLVTRAEAAWERLSQDRHGYAVTDALLALTSALGTLPGRKTIVLFSEGLSLPEAVMPHFRQVVALANDVNVSFYPSTPPAFARTASR